jgi:hypothetical protein
MPWDQRSITKHNKSLHGEMAGHAARIANAVLRRSGDEGMALAVANKYAKTHKRAAGGLVPTSFPQPPPSYLAGTAGSPVNLSALPTFTPQVPSSMGINSAGYMNVPQVGPFTLDPMTGALTPGAQSALQALAQRGLTIGGPQGGGGGGAGGGGGTQAGPSGQAGSLPEGAGTGGAGGGGAGAVGVGGGGGGGGGGFFDPGAQAQPSSVLADMKTGAGIGAFGGPLGMAFGAGLGAAYGAASDYANSNVGAEPGVGGAPGPGASESPDLGDQGGASGGVAREIARRAMGGMMPVSQESPWWTRAEARAGEHAPSGLIMSPIGGRSDHISMNVPGGSYVVPADVMSGIGQGNTMAGGHAFDQMIHSGPFGTKLPMPRLRGTLPKMPGMPRTVGSHHFSRGGRAGAEHEDWVPVIVAGGERIVSPDEVKRLSGGDVEKGHKMLDQFVVEARKHIIKHTKALPGPVT